MKNLFVLIILVLAVIQGDCKVIFQPRVGAGFLLSPDLSPLKEAGQRVTDMGLNFNLELIFKNNPIDYGLELGYFTLFNISGYGFLPDNEGNVKLRNFTEGETSIPLVCFLRKDLKNIHSVTPYVQGGFGYFADSYYFNTADGKFSESAGKSFSGIMLGVGSMFTIKNRVIDLAIKYYSINDSGLHDSGALKYNTSLINIAVIAQLKK